MDDDDTDISAYVFIETVAAIVVQTAVRQFLAVLHVDSLRQTREAKELADRILSIENAYVKEVGVSTDRKRGSYIQKLKDVQTSFQSAGESGKDAKNLFEIAAMQIQAVYRGFWVRDCLDVDHFCITVIQSTWRGYSCRMKYYRDLERIIIVQSWWRRNIARDEAANILAHAIVIQANFRGHRVRTRYTKYRKREARVRKQTAASIVIQAAFKGYRVRTRYRKYQEPEVRAKEAAATIIQSRWRAFAGEALFIRTLVDVLIVQTVVRRWLAQTKMEVVRMKSQASNLKRKLNKNTTSRKDRNEAHINSATQNATAYSKSKILFGENIAATANAERKISMGVQVPYSNGQGSRSNLLQRDEPASYVSGYPLTGETSRLKTPVKLAENELGSRAESTGASYSFRANGPDVSINTCRKPSPLADPPGFVINRTNSGGRRREPASGGRAPTGNPSSNKVTKVSVVEHMMRDTAEDPLDSTPCLSHCLNEEATAANFGTSKVSKSAVVAYPTWDAREEPQGATSHPPHRADQDVTCGARRAQTLIKVQVPHQDNEHNVRGSMQRSAIPGVGGMSSLLLMWREKEKNNA